MGVCESKKSYAKRRYPHRNEYNVGNSNFQMTPNFNIYKNLVIFGQSQTNQNFMHCFNFNTNGFDKINLSSQGNIISK